jgi:putative transposase
MAKRSGMSPSTVHRLWKGLGYTRHGTTCLFAALEVGSEQFTTDHLSLHAHLGLRPCSRKRVARLMRDARIVGVHRRRTVVTTRRDPDATPALALVGGLHAEGPDRLWVADVTALPTRQGCLQLAFIIDAFSRRIVGWRVLASLRAELALDALEMAIFTRGDRTLSGLVHHSDSEYVMAGCSWAS